MRLIDADALVYELTEIVRHSTGEYKHGIDAARLVAMEAPTIGGWVSVKDRLPPLDKDVLVFSYGQMSVCSLVRPDYETADLVWEDAYGLWDDDEGISAVSHWMPLPEAPKEDV